MHPEGKLYMLTCDLTTVVGLAIALEYSILIVTYQCRDFLIELCCNTIQHFSAWILYILVG